MHDLYYHNAHAYAHAHAHGLKEVYVYNETDDHGTLYTGFPHKLNLHIHYKEIKM